MFSLKKDMRCPITYDFFSSFLLDRKNEVYKSYGTRYKRMWVGGLLIDNFNTKSI